MIPAIIRDFRSGAPFTKSNEVKLFRSLATAIAKHSSSIFIDETHGPNVCNVTFTSVTGSPEICEIADLLIISYDRAGSIRATFWQAKKEKTSKWVTASAGNEQFDFRGQFNQWDLLSRRPTIKGSGRFRPPSDLLSSFDSASIGSFGVFYQRGTQVEINHSTAEFVSCINPTAHHPRLSINGYLGKYMYGGYAGPEVITCSTAKSFLEALFAMQVGAHLDPAEAADHWLVDYVRSKAGSSPSSAAAVSAFDRFLGDDRPRSDDSADAAGDGLSVLIVGRSTEA